MSVSEETGNQTIEAEYSGIEGELFQTTDDEISSAIFRKVTQRMPDESEHLVRFRILV